MRTLHVTSPLLHGTDVLQLQTHLHALGYAPGPRDGRYGPTTAAAVKSFQGHHKLHVDGIVGPRTYKALQETDHGTVAPTVHRQASAPGQKALLEAVKHIGAKEQPAGSNRTQFGKWFGVDGVPWCAIFASYCFVLGSGQVLGKGLAPSAGGYKMGVAYVPTLEAWLRARGDWVGRTSPLPGDIAIFNWDGGVADHTGIVEKYLGGGKFTSVEGNTGVGNDSNGGEVMRRERYVSQVNGFGRVR